MSATPRLVMLSFRVTADDALRIQASAQARGVSVSQYLRDVAVNEEKP